MTIVACKIYSDKIVMGCDSQLTDNKRHEASEFNTSKITKVSNEFYFGSAGLYSEMGLFELFCSEHVPEGNSRMDILKHRINFLAWKADVTGDEENTNNQYLIYFQGKVFYVQEFAILEIKQFMSIGSGEAYAYAALAMGNTVKRALEIAGKLDPDCNLTFEIFNLKKENL